MEIIFTNHAQFRIQERKIKFSDVKSVIMEYDKIAKVFGRNIEEVFKFDSKQKG